MVAHGCDDVICGNVAMGICLYTHTCLTCMSITHTHTRTRTHTHTHTHTHTQRAHTHTHTGAGGKLVSRIGKYPGVKDYLVCIQVRRRIHVIWVKDYLVCIQVRRRIHVIWVKEYLVCIQVGGVERVRDWREFETEAEERDLVTCQKRPSVERVRD
jgi:hypothetical protein